MGPTAAVRRRINIACSAHSTPSLCLKRGKAEGNPLTSSSKGRNELGLSVPLPATTPLACMKRMAAGEAAARSKK